MTIYEANLTDRVYAILHEHLGGGVTLSPEGDLLNDLGMDSLEQVELGLKLEKDFHIKIPVTNLRGCVTVGEVIQLVQRIESEKKATSV